MVNFDFNGQETHGLKLRFQPAARKRRLASVFGDGEAGQERARKGLRPAREGLNSLQMNMTQKQFSLSGKASFLLRVTPNILLIALVCASVLAGCSTATLESKKEAGYSKTIKRLYVIAEFGRASKQVSEAADTEFCRRLSALKMNYRYFEMSPIATARDLEQLETELKDFAPEAVLGLRENGGVVDRFGRFKSLRIEGILTDYSSRKVIWHATIETLLSMGGMADEIIKSLQKENLLPGAAGR